MEEQNIIKPEFSNGKWVRGYYEFDGCLVGKFTEWPERRIVKLGFNVAMLYGRREESMWGLGVLKYSGMFGRSNRTALFEVTYLFNDEVKVRSNNYICTTEHDRKEFQLYDGNRALISLSTALTGIKKRNFVKNAIVELNLHEIQENGDIDLELKIL